MAVAVESLGMDFLERLSSNQTKLKFHAVQKTSTKPFPIETSLVSALPSAIIFHFTFVFVFMENHRACLEPLR